MKKTFSCLCICVAACSMSAQSLVVTGEMNSYRADDELVKQQVVFRDPGSSGKDLYWDFRNLQSINDEYSLWYFIPDSLQMNLICGMEHRTRYYYLQDRDSLWNTGYENATTYMEYKQPELRLKYPFTYGDTLFCHFDGIGEYGRRLKLHVKGTTRVHADAEGELLLPDNETVKKALRVHTLRHYTETGKDSVEMILDSYAWYAQGNRYPVFESIKTSVLEHTKNGNEGVKDTVLFTTSFYYPPIEQRVQVRQQEDLLEPEEFSEEFLGNEIFTEVRLYPNPVTTKCIVYYRLVRSANMSFAVYNNAGTCMIKNDIFQQSEGQYNTPIDMTQLAAGVYTIQVKADNEILVLNVVKK